MQAAKEIEFFDRFAQENEDYDVLGERAYARLLHRFAHLCPTKPGDRCVDLGCGSGAFTRRLEVFGLELTGIDISPGLIEAAQRRGDGVHYQTGDITATALKSESFQAIVFSGVLHHFSSPDERVAAMREGWRLLQPGGMLFSYDPYLGSPSMFLYRDPRSPLYSSVGKTDNEILTSKAQMRRELSLAGFEQIQTLPTGGMTFRYVEGSVARRFLPLYNCYEWLLELSGLERWFGTFLVCAARKAST